MKRVCIYTIIYTAILFIASSVISIIVGINMASTSIPYMESILIYECAFLPFVLLIGVLAGIVRYIVEIAKGRTK